jgi:hypothetical protein
MDKYEKVTLFYKIKYSCNFILIKKLLMTIKIYYFSIIINFINIIIF